MEARVRKFLFACIGVLVVTCFIPPSAQAGNIVSDEIACRFLGPGLRPDTGTKVRRIITDLLPERIPADLIVCSGEDKHIAGALKLADPHGSGKEDWIISFDDVFLKEAPREVFRAVMAHELGHLMVNNLCRGEHVQHFECEHEADLFAGTLVGHCSVVRSLEWLIQFKRRHVRRGNERDLRTLIRMLEEEQRCT